MDKNFAYAASDLTDREITSIFKVVNQVRGKYAGLPNTADNLEKLRDEALTRLMEIGIIATLDPAPVFYGEPPTLEIIGKVAGDPIEKYGFDHEQKGYEVNKAIDRGEDWLGQKDNIDKRKMLKDTKNSMDMNTNTDVDKLREQVKVEPVKKIEKPKE